MKYINRAIEPLILKISKQFPAVAVTGPRQSGKSTMLQHLFPKYKYITFDQMDLRMSAKKDPGMFVDKIKEPVIIDEIQYVPEILPYIKIEIDKNRENGQFIFTGSQVFTLMAGLSETLAGRIALFELLPFSFEELKLRSHSVLSVYNQIIKGFYPVVNTQKTDLSFFYGSYLSTYIERDVRQVQNIKDISLFNDFIQLLAARAGNLLNIQEISKECGISHATAKNWLSVLESSRIIYLLRPYFKNITKQIVKSPKLYFTDTGLLAYLLKYQTAETLSASSVSGTVFENMIVTEILKYKINHNLNCDLFFYRDNHQVEADLVINKGNEFVMAEIKSAKTLKLEMAKNLIKIPLVPAKQFLLSFNETVFNINKSVTAIPWWQYKEIL